MKLLSSLFIWLLAGSFSILFAQEPFQIYLESQTIPQLGGLQSYAFGQHNGQWLVLGGRLDGLHQRQPFASFDAAGNNNQVIVIDPIQNQTWAAPLSSLPTHISEQLSSTNMAFMQEGDFLYCLGGYGYSATASDHITYNQIIAVDVPSVINAVKNNQSISSYFRSVADNKFQVTGGRLRKLGGKYFLLGGQKFMGRYNPHGPSHGPGFLQEYTNAVRVFSMQDDGTNWNIQHEYEYVDTVNLHRRDYNAEAQILPNGAEGITMFSGVFQYGSDLPFLNSVTIDSAGYAVNNTFQQFYNHYHCPALPLYSAKQNQMHTVFFGGIAQYYLDANGNQIKDDNVPFVKTIARVTRDANGNLSENVLPVEMPDLLGASAEFIPNKNVAHYQNEVIMLDSITTDTALVGHIYGGIVSTAPNIFFSNTGTQSSATPTIYKVYLLKNHSFSVQEMDTKKSVLTADIIPNPNNGKFKIALTMPKAKPVNIKIYDETGRMVFQQKLEKNNRTKLTINIDLPEKIAVKKLIVAIETPQHTIAKRANLE